MTFGQPLALFPAIGAVLLGGGPITTGALTASIAAGAFLSSLFSGPVGRVRHHGLGIERAILVYGGAMAAFGLVLGAAALGWFAPADVDATTPNLVLIVVASLTLVGRGRRRQHQLDLPQHDGAGRRARRHPRTPAGRVHRGGRRAARASARSTPARSRPSPTLWFPPLLGGFVIIGLVALLVRLSPRFRAYDAEHPRSP